MNTSLPRTIDFEELEIFDNNDPPEAIKSKSNDTVIQHKHHKSKPHFRPNVVDFEDDEDELQYVSEECKEYTTPHEVNSRKRKQNTDLAKPPTEVKKIEVGLTNEYVPSGIRTPCKNCFLSCAKMFTEEQRINIFKTFWTLSYKEQYDFFNNYIKRADVKTHKSDSTTNRRYTFIYFFQRNESLYRVCRKFFLNTLSIREQKIYRCFKRQDKNKIKESMDLNSLDPFVVDLDEEDTDEEQVKEKNSTVSNVTLKEVFVEQSTEENYKDEEEPVRKKRIPLQWSKGKYIKNITLKEEFVEQLKEYENAQKFEEVYIEDNCDEYILPEG